MNFLKTTTILFFTIILLIVNGCVTKTEFTTSSPKIKKTANVKTSSSWKKLTYSKTIDPDCPDCYATPISKVAKIASVSIADNQVEVKSVKAGDFASYEYANSVAQTMLSANEPYENTQILSSVNPINTAYGSYTTEVEPVASNFGDKIIQVAAFRKYASAKRHAKRYVAVLNQYKVTIKTVTKANRPLYRVRIEGFENQTEARNFIASYGISNAFLVRK